MKNIRTKLTVYVSGMIAVICIIFTIMSMNSISRAVFSIVSITIFILSIVICYLLANKLSKPIKQINEMIKEMGQGHLGMRLNIKLDDEIGEMAQAMDVFAEKLQKVLIGTMNQIAEGDLSAEITIVDDDDEITPPLKQMIESLRSLVDEVNGLSEATVEGQLSKRADTEKYQGVYKEIVEGMNNTLDAVIGPLQIAKDYMEKISKGDIPERVTETLKGDYDDFKERTNDCIDAINLMVSDVNLLVEAGIEGNLSVRADSGKHKGDYEHIISGINNILEVVVKPLHLAAENIRQIGNGEIPEKITDDFNGDYNEIKNNVNACVNGLHALGEAKTVLYRLSLNDFTQRIEGDYLGIYGEMAESINRIQYILTHILGIVNHVSIGDMSDYDELKKKGKRSDEDEITPSFIQMIWNINTLVTETDDIVHNAVAGELDYRGNANQLPGAYAKVIDGFNETLDVIIAPIKEASGTLRELSEGNLSAAMTGDYHGKHAVIKNDMNQTIQFLKAYVNEISETLEQVGEGNLNQEITNDYVGDFVNIKIAINSITTRLSDVMYDIDVAASQVDAGARQISDGGQALAQGTTEQASSIQELTASIEEVADETKQNAEHANHANALVIDVRKNAEMGNAQMENMVSAMVEINESSKNISKIIKVIDDIAFQTNILALNAAVEAARAGQHGKGFAVVAEEVRSLAGRSAEAAKETTGLIEGSIINVEAGTQIADETAGSLKVILGKMEEVAGIVGNIAQASNEQASEISQINQGIEQVSQVVQTNSATAEESAAASEELSSQSQLLKGMVEDFELKKQRKQDKQRQEFKQVHVKKQNDSEPQIVLDDFEMDKY